MKKSTRKENKSTAFSQHPEENEIKEITPKKRKKGRYILIYLAIVGKSVLLRFSRNTSKRYRITRVTISKNILKK